MVNLSLVKYIITDAIFIYFLVHSPEECVAYYLFLKLDFSIVSIHIMLNPIM